MNISAILFGLILTFTMPLFAHCSENVFQKSELPKALPQNAEMSYRKNGGMARSYKQIKVSGNLLIIKSLTFNDREPKSFYAEISETDKSALYGHFVENKFDLIVNDERKAIVYDAPSEGIHIRAGRISKNITYGKNSPLSGANLRRFSAVKDALLQLEAKHKNELRQMTDRFAVIAYDVKKHNFIYKNARPLDPDETELALIDSVIVKAVNKYNAGQDERMKISDLSEYNFQFLPVSTESGRKEVWVNAFCSSFDTDWKKEVVFVADGGKCFFNFKINLDDSSFYDFQVNGEA